MLKEQPTISLSGLPVLIMAVIIVVGIGAVFGLLMYLFSGLRDANTTINKSSIEITKNNFSDIDMSNWKIYRNKEYGYEIKYPKDWKNEGNENEYFFQTWFESENTELFIRTDLKGEVNPFALPSFPICYEKNRPLVLFGKKLPKFIASSIEEEVDEKECKNFLLSDEHFIRSEFCINEKLEVYPPELIKGWQEYGYKCGENKDSEILYDFQFFCKGDEWQGRGGLEKCNKLFDQILSTFKFIEK